MEEKPSSNIQVVARVRPCFDRGQDFEGMHIDELNENGIRFEMSQGSSTQYGFNKLFWKNTTQEKIFDSVAKPLIDHAIRGYNATLFAYGQTGSGKTYTLSGGDTYDERGIIPRGISYVYQQIKKVPDYNYTVNVSYIEIFNTIAYDLLSNDKETVERNLDKLLRVNIHDSPGGIILNHDQAGGSSPLIECDDFETALSQLFLGETNRQIAETAANDVSSRSHCLFSLHLEGKNKQTGEIRNSKIHFVDLAGSERVDNVDYKDRIIETKFINLSLYYLHQVIEALRNGDDYIPYRQSRLTLILKDSLGGNCMTTMIAALSSKREHIPVTIETCKFAQTVMTIKNRATMNVSTDPRILIEKLRKEIVRLRHELAVALGEEEDTPITPDEMESIQNQITEYMGGRSEFPQLTPSRFKAAFDFASTNFSTTAKIEQKEEKKAGGVIGDPELKKAIAELQKINRIRENENKILVNMISDMKSGGSKAAMCEAYSQTNIDGGDSGSATVTNRPQRTEDKAEVFRRFYKNHPKFRAIEANKKIMGEKVAQAKSLTNEGHALKKEIEAMRQEVHELSDQTAEDDESGNKVIDEKNSELRAKIQRYMSLANDVRSLKTEIETIDKMIQANKKQVKKDFTSFWGNDGAMLAGTAPPEKRNETKPSAPANTQTTLNEPTGITEVDEMMKKFRATRESILKKAAETRNSQRSRQSTRPSTGAEDQ